MSCVSLSSHLSLRNGTKEIAYTRGIKGRERGITAQLTMFSGRLQFGPTEQQNSRPQIDWRKSVRSLAFRQPNWERQSGKEIKMVAKSKHFIYTTKIDNKVIDLVKSSTKTYMLRVASCVRSTNSYSTVCCILRFTFHSLFLRQLNNNARDFTLEKRLS